MRLFGAWVVGTSPSPSFPPPSPSPSAVRRREQRQQQRVRGVSLGSARHTHPALQAPVSVQLLRRHAPLPGQQLSDMPTA